MFVLIPVLQDTVVGVPPYPFTLQDPSDVRIAECWYARPDAHSCSSLAMCDPRTAGHQVGPTTPIAPMTSGLSWCSSAHLSRGFTQGLPNGASWSAKTLSAAFPHAHPLCGSLPARAGACPALPPVSGRERDIYYPSTIGESVSSTLSPNLSDIPLQDSCNGISHYKILVMGYPGISLCGISWYYSV